VGAKLNAALVVMGDKLGLYRALAGTDGLSPTELAERTGTAERYLREWLNAQAAGGFVAYDPDGGRYTLPPSRRSPSPTPTARRTFPGSSRSPWAR
jgi:predicted transcriptional regulator